MADAAAHTPGGWRAELTLGFARRAGRAVLARRHHCGPLAVQRSFHPEPDDACHVYLLHPPGGVVGGDELRIDIALEADARVLITTPAAGKFYRSAGHWARQHNVLRVAAGAWLEWLPQEAIVYDGARVAAATRVELEPGAGFLGWEIVCLGRPAADECYSCGGLDLSFEIHRGGAPLWWERSRLDGGAPVLGAPWGLAGHSVIGTLVCATNVAGALAALRHATEGLAGDGLFSATQLDDVLVCRYLGDHAQTARRCFTAAWQALRPRAFGRAAVVPRVWLT